MKDADISDGKSQGIQTVLNEFVGLSIDLPKRISTSVTSAIKDAPALHVEDATPYRMNLGVDVRIDSLVLYTDFHSVRFSMNDSTK